MPIPNQLLTPSNNRLLFRNNIDIYIQNNVMLFNNRVSIFAQIDLLFSDYLDIEFSNLINKLRSTGDQISIGNHIFPNSMFNIIETEILFGIQHIINTDISHVYDVTFEE